MQPAAPTASSAASAATAILPNRPAFKPGSPLDGVAPGIGGSDGRAPMLRQRPPSRGSIDRSGIVGDLWTPRPRNAHEVLQPLRRLAAAIPRPGRRHAAEARLRVLRRDPLPESEDRRGLPS